MYLQNQAKIKFDYFFKSSRESIHAMPCVYFHLTYIMTLLSYFFLFYFSTFECESIITERQIVMTTFEILWIFLYLPFIIEIIGLMLPDLLISPPYNLEVEG